jgi:hypothetical protein
MTNLSRYAGLGVAACAASALVAASALGHHSAAMFDGERVEELTGTVHEFQWTNPHTWIQVMVEDEEGQQVEWSIEWGGLNSLARRGYRPTTFQPGDEVRIRYRPHLQGAPAGIFVAAQFEDGREIGSWD